MGKMFPMKSVPLYPPLNHILELINWERVLLWHPLTLMGLLHI